MTPSIAAGGRTPHIRFPDGSSVSDRIAFDGYTLLVIDPASIRVRDVIVSDHSHLLQDNLETQVDSFITKIDYASRCDIHLPHFVAQREYGKTGR